MIPFPDISWIALLPLLLVSGCGLLMLGAGLFIDDGEVLGWGAMTGLVVTLITTATLIGQRISTLHHTFALDGYAIFFDLLILGVGVLVVLMSMNYLDETDIGAGEYYALVLFALAGMMVMTSATDLIVKTPAEVIRARNSLISLVPDIEREGKVLYERPGG